MSSDWYCHNLCNNEKLDTMNRKTFERTMPDYKTATVFDPRPDVKMCGGVKYVPNTSSTGIRPENLELNLYPCSATADCVFPRILGPQPYNTRRDTEYLRRIDIDSYVRGITHYYSQKGNDTTCHCPNSVCTLQTMEETMYDKEFAPSNYVSVYKN